MSSGIRAKELAECGIRVFCLRETSPEQATAADQSVLDTLTRDASRGVSLCCSTTTRGSELCERMRCCIHVMIAHW